jgi:8-oxo-dGTP pyrophosphatase MutT (NUDIX family)
MHELITPRTPLLKSLEGYREGPFFLEEEFGTYRKLIEFISTHPRCFERDNIGHITGSVWLVNHAMNEVLLTHHKKLGIWIQLGGHADGDPDIPSVAMREAYEESGLASLNFVTEGIYDIDIHQIPNSCVAHYDIRYIIQAPANAMYTVSHESHALAWIPYHALTDYTDSRSVLRMAEKMARVNF